MNSTISGADYYIVVLTADEELTTGESRPRPNAMIGDGPGSRPEPEVSGAC